MALGQQRFVPSFDCNNFLKPFSTYDVLAYGGVSAELC
jgi:hypothetical protein